MGGQGGGHRDCDLNTTDHDTDPTAAPHRGSPACDEHQKISAKPLLHPHATNRLSSSSNRELCRRGPGGGGEGVGAQNGLAWLLLANEEGLLAYEGPEKEENLLPSKLPCFHRCSENTDLLQRAAPQLEPQRHLQAYIHLAVSLQNCFWAAGNTLGAQIKSINPARCCAADVLRQMSLEWGDRSLLTSVL